MSTVEHDLMLVRKHFTERGWVKSALLDLKWEDAEPINMQSCGACMTGAVGIATESPEFMDWAIDHHDQVPVEWDWSRRGLAVFTALWEHRPTNVTYDFAPPDHIVGAIVNVNDAKGMTEDMALAWVDRTIEQERG